MVADFGIEGMTFDTELTFKALVSDPVQTQVFQAGGYVDQTQHSVRLPAVTASWSLPDGSIGASGATLSGDSPVAAFSIGKKVIVGGRHLRINGRTHKPGSAWITLVVIEDNQ